MTAGHDAADRHGNFFITDMGILRVVAPHFRSPHAPAALLSRLVHWQAINERNGAGIDENGVCWTYASDTSWEADCGISRGQAHRFIATFVELGWVRQQLAPLGDHPRLVSWYHVDFDAIPDDPGVPRGTASVTRAVPNSHPRGDASVTRASTRGLHIKEKEEEKSEEKPRARRRALTAEQVREWEPSEALRAWTREKNPAITRDDLAQFKDHHVSKGTRILDIDATWRTWVRNSLSFGTVRAPVNGRSPGGSVADGVAALLGRSFVEASVRGEEATYER